MAQSARSWDKARSSTSVACAERSVTGIPMRNFDRPRGTMAGQNGVCGVVVTFHPDDNIGDRLGAVTAVVDALVVIDNSANKETALALRLIVERLGATLVINDKNVGVATALNQGIAAAQRASMEWVWFFDQDSKLFGDFRSSMVEIISVYGGDKPLGIIGCNYVVENQVSVRSPAYPVKAMRHPLFVEVNSVITSGSLHKLELFKRIGGFRDDYFIDMVDIEFCWRAKRYGYAVLRSIKPLMQHSIGQLSEHKILWFTTGTSNHYAFRRYFSARNSVMLSKGYLFVYPVSALRILLARCKSTVLMLAFEKEKLKKFSATLHGFWDGLVGKMGEYPNQ